MEKWKKIAAHIGAYPAALAKWLAVGALIGGIGGVIGSLFHIGVNYATQMRAAHPWILYLLPVLGLIIVGLYRVTKVEGKDTNAVIESVHFGKNVPVLLVPVIFISTVLTHLGGGSAGREGAALQIGGGIGFEAGRLLRLGEKDLPLATLCGMSAVFSALFGTPLTAAIFAMEVISVGVFYYAGLIPCLTAALVGYLVSLLMGVPPTRFAVADPGLDPWTMLLVILLAIGCAVVSILFCRGLQKTGKLAARLLPNPYGRVLVGGALVIVLTLLVGNTNYNGAGMEMVEQAVSGDVEPWAWLWKLLFTAVTIGFGYKGGEVVPSFFVGACFGCVLGGAMGLPEGFGAALHQNAVTSLSQFVWAEKTGALHWTVSLLGEISEEILSPLLEGVPSLYLERDRVELRVTAIRSDWVHDVDELFARAARQEGRHALRFQTPTAFKSRGQYVNLPTTRLLMQSLVQKWNGSFLDCPIEDEDGLGVETLAAGLRWRGFQLRDQSYRLKGSAIPGFVGRTVVENRLSGFHRQLADALLLFSGYSGVGIKTALGMGGVIHSAQP